MSSLILIGDTLIDSPRIRFDDKIIEICSRAGIVLLNLEGPVSASSERAARKKTKRLIADKQTMEQLEILNVSAVLLGNNHIMDAGEKGLRDTVSFLQNRGIPFAGVAAAPGNIFNEITLKNEKGPDYALFSYSHHEGVMFNGSNCGPLPLPAIPLLKEKIRKQQRLQRRIIFAFHGGEEYFSVPWPRRRGFFHLLNDLGVDVIFGQHAHVIQPVEIRNSKPVIYSPGNFYLDTGRQKARSGTDRGFMAEISFDDDAYINLHYIKADRQEKKVSFENDKHYPLEKDVSLIERDYINLWTAECRTFFDHPQKRERKKNFLIRMLCRGYRKCKLIKHLKIVPRKIRDLDILFSSTCFGKHYAKRSYRSGYRDFDF